MEKQKRTIIEIDPKCFEIFDPYFHVLVEKTGATKKAVITTMIEYAVRNDALGLGADAPHIPTKEEKRKKKLAEAKKAIQEMNRQRMQNGATTFVKFCEENYERFADGQPLIEE